jgi:hypothetical protein
VKGSSRPTLALRLLEVFMLLAALAFIYPALFVLNNALKPDAAIKLHPVAPQPRCTWPTSPRPGAR